MSLIDDLIEGGWLKDDRIIEAFRKIKRADFMTNDMQELSGLNEALPIGFGQTISQPLVVAFMIELLEPKEGEKILDVGSGSGWTTALLAELVGEMGKVIAIELIPELKTFGETNVRKYNFIERGIAKFVCGDGSQGHEKEAPFHKILASASVQPKNNGTLNGSAEIPKAWKEQLAIGGRIVAPIGSSIWLYVKKSETEFEKKEHPGFVFVPLIEK
jgi:protein-L-isoaspartate(D-aspartate) O-methyltransferase